MNDGENVYKAPIEQATSKEAPIPPSRIKTFGIIHLVLAGLGIGGLLMSLLGFVIKEIGAGVNAENVQGDAQQALQDVSMPLTIAENVFSIILIIFLIVAGFMLLLRKKISVKCSAVYSFTSIGMKLILLLMGIFMAKDISQAATEMLTSQATGPGMEGLQALGGLMSSIAYLSLIFGPLITLTYPILCLCMLANKDVKSYLAKWGK